VTVNAKSARRLCCWCRITEHGGNCRAEWQKLMAEKAARGVVLIVPRSALCPWCRWPVITHRKNCQIANLTRVLRRASVVRVAP
jgi:hypothetical protein